MRVKMSWQPSSTISLLRQRADYNRMIRQFFAERQVWEVETPILSHSGNPDPQLESFKTVCHAKQISTCYLNTSPEFTMKRLLAAGSGDIYQLCKVFRDGEMGHKHHPEFTLLEWYRVGMDHFALMNEVQALVEYLAKKPLQTEHITYRQLFLDKIGIDVKTAQIPLLQQCAKDFGIDLHQPLLEKDAYLDLLLSVVLEPQLPKDKLVFLYHYPASQAALARVIEEEDFKVGCRFELYWQGLELANGFYELSHAEEQRARFVAQMAQREKQAQMTVPMDELLLAALPQLPECSGVAVGVDRLLMCLLNAKHINEIISFDLERA